MFMQVALSQTPLSASSTRLPLPVIAMICESVNAVVMLHNKQPQGLRPPMASVCFLSQISELVALLWARLRSAARFLFCDQQLHGHAFP